MSVRWMAVQYLGDVLRLPVVNASDMDKPVGHSTLERVVSRIEVNAFSENPEERKTFMPEDENERLRNYAYALEECKRAAHYCEFCPHFHRDFEDENPHCDFDFDALRAAAGMEVDE